MKALFNPAFWLKILFALYTLIATLQVNNQGVNRATQHSVSKPDPIRETALQILDNKCNVCHRKKNPFMVFKEKNMYKRAKRIYQAVFVEKRMPKGNQIALTEEDYQKLKRWLAYEKVIPSEVQEQ